MKAVGTLRALWSNVPEGRAGEGVAAFLDRLETQGGLAIYFSRYSQEGFVPLQDLLASGRVEVVFRSEQGAILRPRQGPRD